VLPGPTVWEFPARLLECVYSVQQQEPVTVAVAGDWRLTLSWLLLYCVATPPVSARSRLQELAAPPTDSTSITSILVLPSVGLASIVLGAGLRSDNGPGFTCPSARSLLPGYAVYAARGPNTLVSSRNCQIASLPLMTGVPGCAGQTARASPASPPISLPSRRKLRQSLTNIAGRYSRGASYPPLATRT